MSWRRESALTAGLPDPCAFYHVHSFAPRPAHERGRARHAPPTATEFASVVARPPVFGAQFHPEKSGPDGLALLRNFARLARAPRHDPPARGGHPRRQGRAAAPGPLRRRRPCTPTTRSRPRARSSRRARATCTWSTWTAPARASRPTSTTCERITRELPRAGAVRRRPALARGRSARRCPPAPSGWWWAPPPTPTPSSWRRRSPPGTRACWWPSTSAAAACRSRAGRARRRCGPRT